MINKLSLALRVSVDVLFNGNGKTDKKGGPTGKVRQIFERVLRLPRTQRAKVIECGEAFVDQKASEEK